jgi:hypothetical protein
MHLTHVHMKKKMSTIESNWDKNAMLKENRVCNVEQMDRWTNNQHSLASLPEQEQMWVLHDEENGIIFQNTFKRGVWWMSIKNVCKPKVLITAKLSKERCISLAMGRRPS